MFMITLICGKQCRIEKPSLDELNMTALVECPIHGRMEAIQRVDGCSSVE